jgi:hypothetical protein
MLSWSSKGLLGDVKQDSERLLCTLVKRGFLIQKGSGKFYSMLDEFRHFCCFQAGEIAEKCPRYREIRLCQQAQAVASLTSDLIDLAISTEAGRREFNPYKKNWWWAVDVCLNEIASCWNLGEADKHAQASRNDQGHQGVSDLATGSDRSYQLQSTASMDWVCMLSSLLWAVRGVLSKLAMKETIEKWVKSCLAVLSTSSNIPIRVPSVLLAEGRLHYVTAVAVLDQYDRKTFRACKDACQRSLQSIAGFERVGTRSGLSSAEDSAFELTGPLSRRFTISDNLVLLEVEVLLLEAYLHSRRFNLERPIEKHLLQPELAKKLLEKASNSLQSISEPDVFLRRGCRELSYMWVEIQHKRGAIAPLLGGQSTHSMEKQEGASESKEPDPGCSAKEREQSGQANGPAKGSGRKRHEQDKGTKERQRTSSSQVHSSRTTGQEHDSQSKGPGRVGGGEVSVDNTADAVVELHDAFTRHLWMQLCMPAAYHRSLHAKAGCIHEPGATNRPGESTEERFRRLEESEEL